MGGRRPLLETTRRWRDSVHATLQEGCAGILGRCVSSSGAESHTAPRIRARFSSEPPKSGSAERRGARVTSRPRYECADVTDMQRHLMMLDEQSSQYRRQREVIIEHCLPLADHIARWFSKRGEPLEDLVCPGGTDGADSGGEPL
jgi:hypothetical protein